MHWNLNQCKFCVSQVYTYLSMCAYDVYVSLIMCAFVYCVWSIAISLYMCTHLNVLCVTWTCILGDLSLGVKRPRFEADHSPLSSDEVKNVWSYTSILPIRLHGMVFSYKQKSLLRWCVQKFPHWADNEINNNKHSLRSNTKGYGGKTH